MRVIGQRKIMLLLSDKAIVLCVMTTALSDIEVLLNNKRIELGNRAIVLCDVPMSLSQVERLKF